MSPATATPSGDGRRLAWLVLATALLIGLFLLPSPAPLSSPGGPVPLTTEGKACLAILVFAVCLWVTEAIPFAVTSLLALLLVPLFGVATYPQVVRAGFGAPIITFFIGVLILSAAFTRSGLGTRLVYQMVQWFGNRTDIVLLGMLIVGSVISWWITKMAVAAMLVPLGVSLLRDAGMKPGASNFGRALMIATAFGPLIGGIATPAGTAANLVAIAQMRELAGVEVTFTRWMAYGAPAAILMVPFAWRILLWLFPPEIDRLPLTREDVQAKVAALGPLSSAERYTLWLFIVLIVTWVMTPFVASLTGGWFDPPVEAVGLAGGLALFVPGVKVLTWKEAQQDIDWAGIIMIVAGLSLGTFIYESGAARWLAWVLLGGITDVPLALRTFVIVLGVSVLRLLFSSNTATAGIMVPILVAMAVDLELGVWATVAPAAFTASMAYVLVSGGPTTIVPYSSGYFSIRQMATAGLLMTVAAAACVAISVAAAQAFRF